MKSCPPENGSKLGAKLPFFVQCTFDHAVRVDGPARNFHLRSRDPLIEKEKQSPLEKVSTKSHFALAVTLDAGGHWRDPNGDTIAETDRTGSTTNGSQSDAIRPRAQNMCLWAGTLANFRHATSITYGPT